MGGETGYKKIKNVWMKAKEKYKKVRILRFKTYRDKKVFFDCIKRNSMGE
jgi:hypothetical protein